MDQSEILRFEHKHVTIKLSDAIRLGAKIRPQCAVRMFERGASCAFGAAYEALTGLYDVEANDVYDYVTKAVGLRRDDPLIQTIVDMNYSHTREQIADYVQAQGY